MSEFWFWFSNFASLITFITFVFSIIIWKKVRDSQNKRQKMAEQIAQENGEIVIGIECRTPILSDIKKNVSFT